VAWGGKRLPSAIRPVVLGRRRRRAATRTGADGHGRTSGLKQVPARLDRPAGRSRLRQTRPGQPRPGRPRSPHYHGRDETVPARGSSPASPPRAPPYQRGVMRREHVPGTGQAPWRHRVAAARAPWRHRAQRAEWHWGQRRWAVAQCEEGRCQMTSVWHREVQIVMRRLSPAPASCAGSGRHSWPATLPRDPAADNTETRRVHGSP